MTDTNGSRMLEVRDLAKTYAPAGWQRRAPVVAVDGVSFALARGRTLALVGESGSGKTTIAYCVLGLVEPSEGTVALDGTVQVLPRDERFRRRVQAVFQDSSGSLNPRMRVGELIAEGMQVHGVGSPVERPACVAALMAEVGLDPALARRRPHECSGGQRQRVAIARALAVEPELLVLDEPVTALDVSVQAQVLNLLADLQASRGLSYLLIAHDLAVVAQVAHQTAVMRAGRIVEMGDTRDVLDGAKDPYTRRLLAAVPRVPVAP